MQLKKLIFRLIAVLLSAFLFLFSLEIISFIALKFLPDEIIREERVVEFEERPDSFITFDSRLGWKLKPNFKDQEVMINNEGQRSSDNDILISARGKELILISGDSMVFGLGVRQEHVFSEILNKSYTDYFFINAGVTAYSPWQEYLVLTDLVKSMRFEKVIIFFTQSNDLSDSTRKDFFNPAVIVDNGELKSDDVKTIFRQPFYKVSQTYTLVSNLFLKGKDLHYLVSKIDLIVRKQHAHVWNMHERIYEKIKQLSIEYDFEVIVVDIPTVREIRGQFHSPKTHTLLANLCARKKFEYYNLLEYYPERSNNLFLSRDEHWSPSGHQWIADFVKKKVIM